MAAEKALVKPVARNSADVAALARRNELPTDAQASRPRVAPGPLRPSQFPVSGAATRRSGFSSPAGQRAHRGPKPPRPSRIPAGAAAIAARPSTGPARAVPDLLRGPGQPLADPVRQEMQARLGADFSGVRVHADSAARASAAEIGARAYTSGDHVVIGDGGADKHTLAHELTHVSQQRTGPVAGTDHGGGLRLSDPSDPFERAAESNAVRAMSGSAPRAQAAPPGHSVRIDRSSTAGSAVADASATATARSPNGEQASQVNRLAISVCAPQGVSSVTVQRAGRRQDLGVGDDTLVVKVIIAGSSNDKWLTHVEKQKKKQQVEWKRQDAPKDKLTYHRNVAADPDFKDVKPGKPEVSFAGPGGMSTKGPWAGGVLDIGSNSIENLVENVPVVVSRIVEVEGKEKENTLILIKGHSRGAVAASRVAKKLSETYKGTETVKIEVVLFDPVPGPGHKGEDLEIDLSELSEFTLVYSVATGWGIFSPQTVFGAKRIIISRQGHLAGIKAGFEYLGQIYKGSRLSSLPSGVYVDKDEYGGMVSRGAGPKVPAQVLPAQVLPAQLIRVRTIDEARTEFRDALKTSEFRTPDLDRKAIIEKVFKKWFEQATHEPTSAGTSEERSPWLSVGTSQMWPEQLLAWVDAVKTLRQEADAGALASIHRLIVASRFRLDCCTRSFPR